MTAHIVRTVEEMLQVVTPVLSEILTAEELAATSLRTLRKPAGHPIPPRETWPRLANSDLLDEDTLLELRTFDYRRGSWMQGIGNRSRNPSPLPQRTAGLRRRKHIRLGPMAP